MIATPTASTVSLTLPAESAAVNPPQPAALPTFNTGTANFTVGGPVLYAARLSFPLNSTNSSVYEISSFVTKGWLGANTTFTTPDLSALNGFEAAPSSGTAMNWDQYTVGGNPLQFVSLAGGNFAGFPPSASVQYVHTFGGFTVP